MKEFTVIWTYIGNYGGRTVQAKDHEDALDAVVGFFSDDFKQKGTVMVFAGKALLKRKPTNGNYENNDPIQAERVL